MPPKRKFFHDPINSREHFDQVISESNTRVNVIDCHLEWCGPCKCMEDNYKALWFGIEDGDPEGRVAFWQAQEDVIPEEMLAKLQLTLIPRFLIIQGGQIKKEINGARLVDIQECMMDLLPDATE